MRKFNRSIFLVFLISLLILSGCSNKEQQPLSRTEIWLDTPCTITVYDKVSASILNKAFNALQDIHNKMNVNSDKSEVSNINRNAGTGYVKVSEETFHVLKEAEKFSELTKGKFDITVGPLVALWGINTGHERVPSPEEIKESLASVNYKNVILNESSNSVMLKNKGMAMDLGGIAKGYAGDVTAGILKQNGVKHAVINLGGNIMTIGSKPDGTDWNIGVQNPEFTENGQYMGILSVSNKAVVTSGIYERYFEKDGKIYHHIFDTVTGYPALNTLASVTIVTKQSINADAYAKAFCMGLKDGMAFVEGLKGVDAIFITKTKEVYITSGLKNNFIITDSSFKIMNQQYQ